MKIVIHIGQELYRLRKDFIFEVTQLQAKLDSVHKEKNVLQSKLIKMERNHIQMKEAMSADINYLRKLNLQLVEQHMKGTNMCVLSKMCVCVCNRLATKIFI